MNIEKTKRDCLPLAITITYLAISLILLVWLGLTYQLYLILLIVGIALWTAYKRKADLNALNVQKFKEKVPKKSKLI